ncbi:RAD55 family ATPase [Methanolobus profundi]|uniref:RecA-superfamily ATPase, KaiC/GvpD/RAD55 family n=1 Tax=Methanolobus profundi TaxID=487685 RepID=A0A1I4RCQ2_9EURY|nr:ATPase domain-containing protein [Methanolobus profundi]SFM49999.1 RecA-superfamily ATPase, KaiC/GvpD/RAD55 family [Methanolobus profundi]
MIRLSSGIPDVDKKIQGGFPEGEAILITGEPGTGKTIFAIHFLYNACKEGHKCAMIATEETPEKIIDHGRSIGLDMEPFVESKQLTMLRLLEKRVSNVEDKYGNVSMNVSDLNNFKYIIPEDVEVIVLDNLGAFAIGMELKLFKDKLETLVYTFSEEKKTSLIIMDATAHELTHRIAEYSTYGTIRLMTKENPYTGKMERFMSIPKMRETEISLELINYTITGEGIKLLQPKTNR